MREIDDHSINHEDHGMKESEPRRGVSLIVFEFLRIMALVAIFAAQLFVVSRVAKLPFHYCFTKPMWVDEFFTISLAKEARVDQLLSKLSQGGDYNPPALHLAFWVLSKFVHVSDEWMLRSFSSVVGAIGLVATYLMLRLQFPWLVSWVAVLGMWSTNPQMCLQMFDGRFYSFWFASIAILCLLLSLRVQTLWQMIGVAIAAILVCSIHYFGIIALGLIAASCICFNFGEIRQRWLVAVMMIFGSMTVAASMPLYFGQRAALPVPTWIDPVNGRDTIRFINGFILCYALSIPVLAYAVQQLFDKTYSSTSSECSLQFWIYAGAVGLFLMPFALTVFSYAIQPAQLDRYAVPAFVAYGPLIAIIAARLNRFFLLATAMSFFIVGLNGAYEAYRIRPDFREAIALARLASNKSPVVMHWTHAAYPLSRYAGIDPKFVRVSFLFRDDPLSRFDAVQEAVTNRSAELFHLPKTLTREELATLDEFYLLADAGEEKRYDGWTAEPMDIVGDRGWTQRGFHMKRLK